MAGDIGGPEFETESLNVPSPAVAETRIGLSEAPWVRALARRFENICPIRSQSQSIGSAKAKFSSIARFGLLLASSSATTLRTGCKGWSVVHVDWGDIVQANAYGYGSPMRRASEMPWFTEMRQIGIRGLGSGTADQHDDARRWGSRLVTMHEVESAGVEAALEGLGPGGDCFHQLRSRRSRS
jgi:hypothetical protein